MKLACTLRVSWRGVRPCSPILSLLPISNRTGHAFKEVTPHRSLWPANGITSLGTQVYLQGDQCHALSMCVIVTPCSYHYLQLMVCLLGPLNSHRWPFLCSFTAATEDWRMSSPVSCSFTVLSKSPSLF